MDLLSSILKKKKKKEEKDEEISFSGETATKSKRGRKKKETIKPWGKKERFLVLFIILVTVGVSMALSLDAREWKLPGFPRINKLPDFNLPFLTEETIIIEGNKKDNEKSERTIDAFEEKTINLSGVYGLYVARLANGSSYGVNENETFQAASLIKLPVMMAMFEEFENGNLDPETKYVLKESDKVGGSGSLYSKPEGYTMTYYDLVRLMGKQSDNTAYNICRNLLGDERIEETIVKVGMTATSLEKNETTPYDVGTFFEQLWNNNIVSKESRDEILEFLTDTVYEDHLVAGIPEEVRVAHKYGREVHVVSDGGIVFGDDLSDPEAAPSRRHLIMVIMSKGVIESEADKIFPDLARLVYEIEME